MFINRKRNADREEEARQKQIAYKKFFGANEGNAVLTDLINKYYVLNPTPDNVGEYEHGIAEGKRRVVLEIMSRFYVDLAHLEKLFRGELT